MDFLKHLDILDAIYWLGKAWIEVPQSALKGIQYKILLSRHTRTFDPILEEKIDKVVEKGQRLGISDLDSESDNNLCRYCKVDHCKNKYFTKDHEMIPLQTILTEI